MAVIQHSIDVNVSITRLYIQLTQFEDYPRFMENVESVQQLSKTRLHWIMKEARGPREWDAEVTEQEENSHIAWHNTGDGNDAGRIDMQELGPNLSRITFIVETKSGAASSLTGGKTGEEAVQQLEKDLAALKAFLEESGARTQAHADPQVDTDVSDLDEQTQAGIMNRVRTESQRRTSASVSGSPTEVLEDEPTESGAGKVERPNPLKESRSSGLNSGRTTP